jgi:protein ImuB
MFACLYVPDFPVQATLLSEPLDAREVLRRSPIVILEGPENLLKVAALNDPARNCGIEVGMTKLQVEACDGVLLRKRSEAEENLAQAGLIQCANSFSPRVESTCADTALLDLTGTERLFGAPENTARKISATAQEQGFYLRVAVASNPDTALYAARGFSGITIIPDGQETRRMASLNVELLPISTEMLDTLNSWGIRTFSSLADLPEIPLTERLGQSGLYFQKLACGQIKRTLVPIAPAQKFVESYEFDDPVETLESLSFVLNRLLQQICSHLVLKALSTNELRLTLDLAVAQRQDKTRSENYQHEWKLPVPTQDWRTLFTLVRLDLERNTFSAPIRKVTIEALPTKPRTAQGNLFAPPSPDAEKLEITLARIRGVVGSTDADGLSCVGSPELLDTHKPASFSVQLFSTIKDCPNKGSSNSVPTVFPIIALRAFRPPLETSVELNGQTPHIVRLWKKPRHVVAASGPWCSSGNWWNSAVAWVREEWDVALRISAEIGFYRIYLDRIRKQWFVEGIFD